MAATGSCRLTNIRYAEELREKFEIILRLPNMALTPPRSTDQDGEAA